MKYRVTPRGWVVFSILGVLIIYSIFSFLQILLKDDINEKTLENENEPSITKDIDAVLTDDLESNEDDSTHTNDESESPDEEISNPDEEVLGPDEEKPNTDESSVTPDDSYLDSETAALLEEKDTLYFDPNLAIIKDVHKETLDKWQEWLSDHLTFQIVIEGHINGYPNYKDTPFGLSISEERAWVLKDYLVALGIDSKRIILKNLGSQEQAILTDDYSQHYLNRRAVIYFKQ